MQAPKSSSRTTAPTPVVGLRSKNARGADYTTPLGALSRTFFNFACFNGLSSLLVGNYTNLGQIAKSS